MTSSRIFLLLFLSLMSNCVLAVTDKDQVLHDYVEEVQKIIKNNWQPKKTSQSYTLLTRFTIDELGKVQNINFINRSDDEEINEMALAAIQSSGPFPRPTSIKNDDSIGDLEIEFGFDYKVNKPKQPITTKPKPALVSDSVLLKDRRAPVSRNIFQTIFVVLLSLLVLVFRIYYFFANLGKKKSKLFKKKSEKKPVAKESCRYDPTNVGKNN